MPVNCYFPNNGIRICMFPTFFCCFSSERREMASRAKRILISLFLVPFKTTATWSPTSSPLFSSASSTSSSLSFSQSDPMSLVSSSSSSSLEKCNERNGSTKLINGTIPRYDVRGGCVGGGGGGGGGFPGKRARAGERECVLRVKKGIYGQSPIAASGKTLPVRSGLEIKNSVNSRQTLNRLEEEKRKRGA